MPTKRFIFHACHKIKFCTYFEKTVACDLCSLQELYSGKSADIFTSFYRKKVASDKTSLRFVVPRWHLATATTLTIVVLCLVMFQTYFSIDRVTDHCDVIPK